MKNVPKKGRHHGFLAKTSPSEKTNQFTQMKKVEKAFYFQLDCQGQDAMTSCHGSYPVQLIRNSRVNPRLVSQRAVVAPAHYSLLHVYSIVQLAN